MSNELARTYRVKQLNWDLEHGYRNEAVESLDDLVTHHPHANRNARMVDSKVKDVEAPARRSHAYIGGEFQEVEMLRTDEYRALQADQVLLTKDFILEDPHSVRPRDVDVPAPIDGYIQRVDAQNGLVEIRDRPHGDVVARVRHLSNIAVREGDGIAYGQSLGQQNNIGIAGLRPGQAMHVHLEIDSRYYQQYGNYIDDLVNGRLPVQAEHRQNVQPLPVLDDGTFRLGESDRRIGDLQRVMANERYRAAEGRPLDRDGVYRPSMQGALLDFQREHGVPQTGDIDPATLRFAPAQETQLGPPPVDCELPGLWALPGHARPPAQSAPGHPDHPDHRLGLPNALPAPINGRVPGAQAGLQQGPFSDPFLNQAYAAALGGDDAALGRVAHAFTHSSKGQEMSQLGRDLLAQQHLQEQEMVQSRSRGRSM